MLIVISPAKTLDFDTPATTQQYSEPELLTHSEQLISTLRQLSPDDIGSLMNISSKLAELNVNRYHDWQVPFTADNAKQAVLAFKGDVYSGLEADSLTPDQLAWAQQHLRILSGLYGALKPLDLMQAYRLEMGTRLSNDKGKNLYAFWGDAITDRLNEQLAQLDSELLVNLASKEYFKAINVKKLQADIVTPEFKDWKNGQYKIISFFAKKARGMMTRWIIENQITQVNQLTDFAIAGYRYSDQQSDASELVFIRDEKPD